MKYLTIIVLYKLQRIEHLIGKRKMAYQSMLICNRLCENFGINWKKNHRFGKPNSEVSLYLKKIMWKIF